MSKKRSKQSTPQRVVPSGPLSDAIRARIVQELDAGGTLLGIAKSMGNHNLNPLLGRFLRRERSIDLTTADRIAEHFGLEITETESER